MSSRKLWAWHCTFKKPMLYWFWRLEKDELEGQIKDWKEATYPMHMTTYWDILLPIHRTSVDMQSDFHGPVKVVKRIWDSGWTMESIVLALDEALDNTLFQVHQRHSKEGKWQTQVPKCSVKVLQAKKSLEWQQSLFDSHLK